VHSGQGKKILMAVPSIVQEQFGAEAANFLDPTSGIKIHAVPGESFEQRLQAYRDPEKHAVVMTHASVRDDSVRLLASHRGISTDDAARWAMEAQPEELKENLKAAFAKEGVNFDALMVDEGHDALNRKGKPDSLLARIIDAHGHNASHYIGATGSPVKNDPSEAHDWLHKIDPVRYPKSSRDEFLRRYGTDSAVSRRALKAELSRYFFTERVGSGKTAHHHDANITLDAEQNARIADIEKAAGKLRLGENPVKWAKMLAPKAFEGKPEEEHAAIADGVRKAVGTFRESAMDRVINIGGAKMTAAVKMARESIAEGKPVVIFAHRLEAVEALHKAMEDAGLRVVSISGKDSSKDKPGKLAAFQGAPGRAPTADILIASDAASTGANLQRGKHLIHFDQPMTYKTHEQRTARIDRLGQTSDVEVTNLLADHAYDRNARARVQKKQVLAGIYQSKEGYLDDSGIGMTLRALRARKAQQSEDAA
jgi:superfamily II DNA or RNA helicase